MTETRETFSLWYTEKGLEAWIPQGVEPVSEYTRHFTQREEFFLKLPEEYVVPSFDVHHDIEVKRPSAGYMDSLRRVVGTLVGRLPGVFEGLTYSFDPANTLIPEFFRVYKVGDRHYMYLLKLELRARPGTYRMIRPGTNLVTPEYATDHVFLEPIILSLDRSSVGDDTVRRFWIKKNLSNTYIGERGEGIYRQGLWADHEISKFVSKLLLPVEKSYYPYFPFQCKFESFVYEPIAVEESARKDEIRVFANALGFVEPHLDTIQKVLKKRSFDPRAPYFAELKSRIPDQWYDRWRGLELEPYLTETELKEYRIVSQT
jgi:hypothetical protein